MPKRKSTPRRRSPMRRRTRRRKLTYGRKRMNRRSRAIRMFPATSKVELTYCEEVNIPNKTAGSATYNFILNGLFDPNSTGIGHQPRGFDQWMQIYNKYTVIGARVKVEPLSRSGGDASSTTMFGFIDDDADSDGHSITDLIELNMPGTRYKYVEISSSTNNASLKNSKRNPVMYFKVGMKKFFGLAKKTQMLKATRHGDADTSAASSVLELYTGQATTNPPEKCYLKLHTEGVGGGTSGVLARVTVKYITIFHDPKEIGSS